MFEDLPNHPPDFKKAFFWTDGLAPSRYYSFRRIRKYLNLLLFCARTLFLGPYLVEMRLIFQPIIIALPLPRR